MACDEGGKGGLQNAQFRHQRLRFGPQFPLAVGVTKANWKKLENGSAEIKSAHFALSVSSLVH